jgi:shikimate kinase
MTPEKIGEKQKAKGTTRAICLVGPRACGKSTVGKALLAMLPSWRFVDLDEAYEAKYKKMTSSDLMLDLDNYHAQLRDLLLRYLEYDNTIIAVSGGSLVNKKNPFGCMDSLQACKQKSKMVLVLPSRFDWRNMSLLYKRECARNYGLPASNMAQLKEICRRNYQERIPFYKDHADLILYGSSPTSSAKQILNTFQLA